MLTNSKQNILESWKSHFYVASSELNINKSLDRDIVDFIYTTLLDFWKEEHFNVNMLNLIYEDKLHFIVSALNKATLPSFYYLLETSILIIWAKSKNIDSYNKLSTVKYKSDACKEILFEIYIEWILCFNSIPYQTNVTFNNQLKEGYCIIDDATYLIECKKRYGLEAQQLKIRQFISAEIFRISKKIRVGFEFICIIKLKSKTLTRQQLSESLKEFKNYILNTGQKDSVVILDYEFMNFEIFPFEEELSKKLTDKTIETDIFFICKNSYEFIEDYLPKFIPGSGGTIYENPKFRFHITIYFNLIINHEKIISKLIDSINKAKAQHRSDQSPQIIIIDNEFAEDFRTPMLNGNVLYEEKLQEYVNRHTSNAIIILLYRNFTQNIPDIKFSIICKAEQAQIRKILEKLDFSPIDLNKFSLRST